MENGAYVDGSYWFYAPNKGAPVAFAVLFLVSGLGHLHSCFRYGNWRVTALLPWSALLFVVGYILREVGAFHYDNLPIYIASTVFLYSAPPVYELSNYFVLSRLLHYIPYLSPIHPGRVIITFAGLSAAIEAITANGAAKSANADAPQSQLDAGKALLKTALILQLAILALYLLIAGRFHYNCMRSGILDKAKSDQKRRILAVLITLYASCTLISIRTIYRTAEYFEAASIHAPAPGTAFDIDSISIVIRYEWFFWVFESSVMLCNSLLFNFRHPGKYLPKSLMTYIGEDGIEREGVEFKDRRHLLARLFDPFDLWGLIRGTDEKWWEANTEIRTEDIERGPEERNVCGKLMDRQENLKTIST